MRNLLPALFLAAASSFVVTVSAQNCVVADNCEFYKCLERKYNCGPSGYPVNYGEKFCQIFLNNHQKLDSKGQSWATSTRLCLQRALLSTANSGTRLTCEQLRKLAFNSHPACYTQSGNSICGVGFSQMTKVMNLVGIQWTGEFWTQFSSVAKTCGASVFSYLKEAVSQFATKLVQFF